MWRMARAIQAQGGILPSNLEYGAKVGAPSHRVGKSFTSTKGVGCGCGDLVEHGVQVGETSRWKGCRLLPARANFSIAPRRTSSGCACVRYGWNHDRTRLWAAGSGRYRSALTVETCAIGRSSAVAPPLVNASVTVVQNSSASNISVRMSSLRR